MKYVGIGVHLRREDIEPEAEAFAAGSLYVSSVGVADDQPLSDRELIVRVASVRAALLERATFIAIRYGFSFRTAAEAESKCAGRLQAWARVLEENRGRVEFTLKIAAPGAARPDRHDFESGAAYLRALHEARDAASVPPELRAAVERLIVPLAVRHRWIKRDATSVELAGLIGRADLPRLGGAGDALKREVPGAPFLLSAPWPLEVFADADHE